MTNVEMLQQKIDESGMSNTAIAAALDMSVPTYYSRKTGKSEFTASEMMKLVDLLNLNKMERDAIFFGE